MVICFDLDGTLIDSSERMFRLFLELVPECTMSKDEYWAFKRGKMNHKRMLELFFPSYDFDSFNIRWLSRIEKPEYLDMDNLFPDTEEVLEKLSSKNSLVLLTARQSKSNLYDELRRLNIINYFETILLTEGNMSKEELIDTKGSSIKNSETVIFVGDMGADIELGKRNGSKTVAITHGFMSEEKLREYHPDFIINELSELVPLLDGNRLFENV